MNAQTSRMAGFSLSAFALAGVALLASQARAEDNAQQIALLESKLKLIEAQTELAEARAKKANVLLDKLPSYEAKTTTDASTGELEATILSAGALARAASLMEPKMPSGKLLILTGGEQFQFGKPFTFNAEMRSLKTSFPDKIIGCVVCSNGGAIASTGALSIAVSAVGALAGMIRSEVELKSIATAAVDSGMLAAALAAKLNAKGHEAHVLGGSPGMQVNAVALDEHENDDKWAAADRIAAKYAWLVAARSKASDKLKELGNSDVDKKTAAELTAWLSRFDTFNTRVSTPNKEGTSELLTAVLASQIEDNLEAVVRVEVEAASGSLKNSKNIATFFGADPLRVTGGLVASYTTFQREDNKVARPMDWGAVTCSTKPMRLRQAKAAKFGETSSGNTKMADCREI